MFSILQVFIIRLQYSVVPWSKQLHASEAVEEGWSEARDSRFYDPCDPQRVWYRPSAQYCKFHIDTKGFLVRRKSRLCWSLNNDEMVSEWHSKNAVPIQLQLLEVLERDWIPSEHYHELHLSCEYIITYSTHPNMPKRTCANWFSLCSLARGTASKPT